MLKVKYSKSSPGFMLMDVLMSLGIFVIIAAGVLGAYAALARSVKVSREKTVLASMATNYLEIVKNMPYSQVGTINGNPHGSLADWNNAITQKIEAYTYKIYYEVTYIDDPADGTAPADVAAADYKQVKMKVLNTQTSDLTTFVTNVVPKGLENTSNAGALWIRVFNAVGQPVEGANVHIEYPTTTPSIILDRTTAANGEWVEVGLPPAVNNYRIVVTKPGYTTDRTYPRTLENPNPVNPDSTIAVGQITQVSFTIDLVSTLNIRTVNELCQNISGVNMNVRGSKLIGTNPNVYKYNQNHTSAGGLVSLNNMEWDSYIPTLLTGQSWVMRGTSPIQKIDVLPGTTHTFTMVLGTNSTANSILVIVKDSATGAAIEGANVHLRKGGSVPQDYYGVTSGSVWEQFDWTGGSGYVNWSSSSPDRYYQDDANIDINSAPTGVRLNKTSGRYALSGFLESSVFDTGTPNSNFSSVAWEPTSQDPDTTLAFQIATSNNISGPWEYLGPDGTNATYYTVPGTTISSVHDNNQYVKYKAYLSTIDNKDTPVLTLVNINYVSGCATPGQYWFGDLTAGNNYDLDITMPGYADEVINSININGNQTLEVLMSP